VRVKRKQLKYQFSDYFLETYAINSSAMFTWFMRSMRALCQLHFFKTNLNTSSPTVTHPSTNPSTTEMNNCFNVRHTTGYWTLTSRYRHNNATARRSNWASVIATITVIVDVTIINYLLASNKYSYTGACAMKLFREFRINVLCGKCAIFVLC